jgi:hypothetical protein
MAFLAGFLRAIEHGICFTSQAGGGRPGTGGAAVTALLGRWRSREGLAGWIQQYCEIRAGGASRS